MKHCYLHSDFILEYQNLHLYSLPYCFTIFYAVFNICGRWIADRFSVFSILQTALLIRKCHLTKVLTSTDVLCCQRLSLVEMLEC